MSRPTRSVSGIAGRMPALRKLAFLPLAAAIAGLLYLPFYGNSSLGQMEVRSLGGKVEITRDGTTFTIDGTSPLEAGDLVLTAGDGRAELRLAGDRKVWLAPSSSIKVNGPRSIESRSGGVLASTTAHMKLSSGNVHASSEGGVLRLDQGVGSARASALEGEMHLRAAGQAPLEVPALFQASVAAGRLPARVVPYALDATDEWDATWLQEVSDLDEQLEAMAAAFSSQLGSSRPSLSYFSALAERPVPFMQRYLKRSPADLLIGFTIARTSGGTAFRQAFKEAFRLADLGGEWGVIASILRSRPPVLLSQLEDLIVGTGLASTDVAGAEPVFSLGSDAPSEVEGVPADGLTPVVLVDEVQPGEGANNPEAPADPQGEDRPDRDDSGNDDDGDDGDQPEECSSEAECTAEEIIEQLPDPPPPPGEMDPLSPRS